MGKLVSVIVVAYNNEDTILETLNSIYIQTYKNLELIVSDDCSTDHTMEITLEWLNAHKGRFYSASVLGGVLNRGIPANINKALRAARGDYIQLIAGDDIFLPDGLERRMGYVRHFPNDIVCTRIRIQGNGKDGWKEEKRYQQYFEMMQTKPRRIQYRELIRNDYILPLCVGPLSRKVYDEIGFFDERYKLDEDWILFLKLVMHGYKFASFADITAVYRWNDSSVSHGSSPEYLECQKKLFKEVRKPLMMRNGMFYSAFYTRMNYVWMDIQAKSGKRSLQYKAFGILMCMIRPKIFLIWLRNRLEKG